jgi:hypothetical protein
LLSAERANDRPSLPSLAWARVPECTLTVNYVERMANDHSRVVSFGQGFAVVVDGSWIEEGGGLKLLLEQGEMTGETHEPRAFGTRRGTRAGRP